MVIGYILGINLTKRKKIRMVLFTFYGPIVSKSVSGRQKARINFYDVQSKHK